MTEVEETENRNYKAGIWRAAVVLEASFLPELEEDPLKVLKPIAPPATAAAEAPSPSADRQAIAVCKQGQLNTYEFVNEYSTPPAGFGCALHRTAPEECRYPNTIVCPSGEVVINFEEVFEQLGCTFQDLQLMFGLPTAVMPDVLLVSSHFLESYGFVHQEVVWFRHFTPVPLTEVIVTPLSINPSSRGLDLRHDLEEIVGKLYDKAEATTTLAQQDFKFVFQLRREDAPSQSQDKEDEFEATLTAEKDGEEREKQDKEEEEDLLSNPFSPPVPSSVTSYTIKFGVLETSPVLQGAITGSTRIIVIPSRVDEQDRFERSGSFTIYRSCKKGGGERNRSNSTVSASDFQYEERLSSLLNLAEPEDYNVEAIAVGNLKLQSQYIVLPKEEATKHAIFHCQNVWVSAASSSSHGESEVVRRRLQSTHHGNQLASLTLPLMDEAELKEKEEEREGRVEGRGGGGGWGERMHIALALLYDNPSELERYTLPPRLGHQYSPHSLKMAYVHPELLFYLFPETLSPSRKYTLTVKRVSRDIPTAKKLRAAEVFHPGTYSGDEQPALNTDVNTLQKHLFRSLLVSEGDVFSVKTDTGKCYFKVLQLSPTVNRSAAVQLDIGCTLEANLRKVNSYIPDLVPPSPHLPSPPSFWEDIRPPGLDQYCDTLFSYFIPALHKKSRGTALQFPSVLLSGPTGVGKGTVVRSVARRCRMHVVELNCFDFCMEAIAYAEKKIVVDIDNAISNVPVVLLLNHIHVMGRKNVAHEEPRLCAMFERMMDAIKSSKVSYPIVVVGVTTQPQLVPPRVQSCFLHQLDVAPPTQPQRTAILSSLGSGYHLACDVELEKLAQQTAGFVLGDLAALLSKAYHLAFNSVTQHYLSTLHQYHRSNVNISGVIISLSHIERALEDLHSSHSDAIGAPKIPNVSWEDVGGLGEAKREILDTIQLPLLHPELFPSGLRRSGVLLYGAPGTGKTLLAKAVATECSLNFLSVKGPELINMYVGQSEENVREVFVRARSAAPCVIFFDELDSIAPNRGRSGDSGGVMDRVVSQLLAELDGLQKSEDVFVIGATNRPDLIDPALLRPGRFDRLVYLGVSDDVDSKHKILKAITRKFTLSHDVDLAQLASQCPSNVTGADLYSLCSDAMLTALRRRVAQLERAGTADEDSHEKMEVAAEDFAEALAKFRPSVSAEELESYKSIKSTMS